MTTVKKIYPTLNNLFKGFTFDLGIIHDIENIEFDNVTVNLKHKYMFIIDIYRSNGHFYYICYHNESDSVVAEMIRKYIK